MGTCRIPPIATEFEDLGFALEDWLAKKRQYREFSSRDGTLCQIEDDNWMASMYEFLHQSRKETVVFKGDEDTFESLFDKLVSFASAKHIFEIGQQISSYWYEEGEKDPHAMEEQGRQVEVGHGQACHLLGLWEHLSHESRLFPQQRLDQRQRKSPAKLRKMAEVVTSLKMAPPAKVTSQVRRAKRKAHARTKACFQLKVILGVNSSGKRIGSGNWHTNQWKESQWDSGSDNW